ncbi:entericidin A/B family lipoprotein [Polymorphobacter sp.]
MRKTFALVFAASIALAACNTVGGAGEDLSSAGKAITKTSDDVKN